MSLCLKASGANCTKLQPHKAHKVISTVLHPALAQCLADRPVTQPGATLAWLEQQDCSCSPYHQAVNSNLPNTIEHISDIMRIWPRLSWIRAASPASIVLKLASHKLVLGGLWTSSTFTSDQSQVCAPAWEAVRVQSCRPHSLGCRAQSFWGCLCSVKCV